MTDVPEDKRSLRTIRMYYVCCYGAMGSIEPYLNLYYHSALKLDGEVIGLLNAISSFTTFLVSPLWGILTDKIGGDPFRVIYINFFLSLLGFIVLMNYRGGNLWCLSLCICLIAAVQAPLRPLFNSMVLANLKDRSSFGRSRLFGTIGFGCGTSLVGLLRRSSPLPTDTSNDQEQIIVSLFSRVSDEQLPFAIHVILSIPAFFSLLAFHRMNIQNQKQRRDDKLSTQKEAESSNNAEETKGGTMNQLTQTRNFILRADVMAFFVVVIVFGASLGAIESFCSVSMSQAGLSKKTIGIFRLLSVGASIPMYWFAGNIKSRLGGTENIFILALVLFAIRFALYGLMSRISIIHPFWLGAVAEGMRGVVGGLFQSTSTVYANNLAPPELRSTVVRG